VNIIIRLEFGSRSKMNIIAGTAGE